MTQTRGTDPDGPVGRPAPAPGGPPGSPRRQARHEQGRPAQGSPARARAKAPAEARPGLDRARRQRRNRPSPHAASRRSGTGGAGHGAGPARTSRRRPHRGDADRRRSRPPLGRGPVGSRHLGDLGDLGDPRRPLDARREPTRAVARGSCSSPSSSSSRSSPGSCCASRPSTRRRRRRPRSSSVRCRTVTPAMRGQILDTNGQVLADSVERFTIAADPTVIPEYTVKVDGVRTEGRRHPCRGRPRAPARHVAGGR